MASVSVMAVLAMPIAGCGDDEPETTASSTTSSSTQAQTTDVDRSRPATRGRR